MACLDNRVGFTEATQEREDVSSWVRGGTPRVRSRTHTHITKRAPILNDLGTLLTTKTNDFWHEINKYGPHHRSSFASVTQDRYTEAPFFKVYLHMSTAWRPTECEKTSHNTSNWGGGDQGVGKDAWEVWCYPEKERQDIRRSVPKLLLQGRQWWMMPPTSISWHHYCPFLHSIVLGAQRELLWRIKHPPISFHIEALTHHHSLLLYPVQSRCLLQTGQTLLTISE